jgi:lauroyl/myristoyl acyltransferase
MLVTEILSNQHDLTDEILITQKLASEIERVIRLYPEQWCWNYKRWPPQGFHHVSFSPN